MEPLFQKGIASMAPLMVEVPVLVEVKSRETVALVPK